MAVVLLASGSLLGLLYAASAAAAFAYHWHHTVWHLWCGAAGVCLALGYGG